jgi:hypothetical protein
VYLLLANLIVGTHALLVLCVLTGTVAAIAGALRRYPRLQVCYYLLLMAVLSSHFLRGECIMTVWEKSLRNLDTPGSAYHTSCLRHYLPWLPIPVLNGMGPAMLVMGMLAYPFWRLRDYRRQQMLPERTARSSEECEPLFH